MLIKKKQKTKKKKKQNKTKRKTNKAKRNPSKEKSSSMPGGGECARPGVLEYSKPHKIEGQL